MAGMEEGGRPVTSKQESCPNCGSTVYNSFTTSSGWVDNWEPERVIEEKGICDGCGAPWPFVEPKLKVKTEARYFYLDNLAGSLRIDMNQAIDRKIRAEERGRKGREDSTYFRGLAEGIAIAIDRIQMVTPIPIGEALRPQDV
jgi:hypothetical protein